MAHCAELNENNHVIRVIVVSNEYEPDVEQWAQKWAGGGVWKQTSYNGTIRKHYAGIGFTYNETLDAFIAPKCHEEATLDETNCVWICENTDHIPNEGEEMEIVE
jgi:hypothetical protein